MRKIMLGQHHISDSTCPYIIAEIGVNHNGSINKAKELIDLAKEGGANAAKFQSYKAGRIAAKKSPSYWDTSKEPTTNQYELFKKHDVFNEADYVQLSDYCKTIEIDFLSTPFDADAIDFLEPLMPFYKIASADITNTPFLRHIASKQKPVVLSTGSSHVTEIEVAVQELKQHGVTDIALLHCVLNYPTPYEYANVNMIKDLLRLFPDHVIGYSDHTFPDKNMLTLTASYLLGARIIEKHFTDDKTIYGNDHFHSMDVNDLKIFTDNIKFLHTIGGSDKKASLPSEEISRKNARRSIVLDQPIRKNQQITPEMITYKRPAHGISPIYWDEVIGMYAQRDMDEDHILKWQDIYEKNELA